MLTFTGLLHNRRNIDWRHSRPVNFILDERSTCEDCHKPKTSFTYVDIRPHDQVLCDDRWKSEKVDKWVWSDDEDTDEGRDHTSIVIKTTSCQIENGKEEVEKPEHKGGSQSKGSIAIVGDAEGLTKMSDMSLKRMALYLNLALKAENVLNVTKEY